MQNLPSLSNQFAEHLDDHVVVCAVLQGWQNVKRNIFLDPQFEIFELWDRKAFSNVRILDRIAALRMLRRVGKYLASPDTEKIKESISTFYHVKSCQNDIGKRDIINYTPWPGIRAEMAENRTMFETNKFWNMYLRSFHLLWPFDVIDICVSANSTGLLTLSDEFTRRSSQLGCWTLSKEFLDTYPHLRPFAGQFEPSVTLCKPSSAVSHFNVTDKPYITSQSERKTTNLTSHPKSKKTMRRRINKKGTKVQSSPLTA